MWYIYTYKNLYVYVTQTRQIGNLIIITFTNETEVRGENKFKFKLLKM